jgi:hypothetical protein
MDALSPNTSALLNYLSATNETSFSFGDYPAENVKIASANPTSLPPSAFFNAPRPSRDTPELTPESSNTASESPEGLRAVMATDSEEDVRVGVKGHNARKASDAGAMNKRKAGHGHTVQEEHDDEDEGA